MNRRFSMAVLALAMVCAMAAVGAGLGTRWGFWHFSMGFKILTWAAYGGILVVLLGLAAVIVQRGSRVAVRLALLSIIIGALTAAVPWLMKQRAQQVPAIHDITTDTENPPEFVTILSLRRDAPNSAVYGGAKIAAQQKQAYPDLQPLVIPLPPPQAYQRAFRAAREMDWQIVDSNQEQNRIEATDTTLWFGFKDDVVVRLTALNGSTRIDVRSVSRVGRSDVGTNAARIRVYLSKIAAMS
jgi:uncharacterized protein (DUF1499 family)